MNYFKSEYEKGIVYNKGWYGTLDYSPDATVLMYDDDNGICIGFMEELITVEKLYDRNFEDAKNELNRIKLGETATVLLLENNLPSISENLSYISEEINITNDEIIANIIPVNSIGITYITEDEALSIVKSSESDNVWKGNKLANRWDVIVNEQ